MSGKVNNKLVVIENGILSTYLLDDKLVWEIGRPSKENEPDIKLYSTTVSRKHGKFQNMDGIWFYLDNNGKNGTVYNNKHIKAGMNGRVKPVMLEDGDVFVFGGGEEAIISCKTIWAMFTNEECNERWQVIDTKGLSIFSFTDGKRSISYQNPKKGTIVKMEKGMAIYMGDITYLQGDICVMSN